MSLTNRQRRVLDTIQDRLKRQGFPPIVRELAEHLGVSIGTVQAHLRALERKGALKRRPFRARGLYLTAPVERSGGDAVRNVPIVGPVAAGTPLLAVENSEGVIPVYTEWAKGEELFFVRVKGESMMPTLWDGDYLLIRRQAAVENEAIAVALIEGEVVVKRVGRTCKASPPGDGPAGDLAVSLGISSQGACECIDAEPGTLCAALFVPGDSSPGHRLAGGYCAHALCVRPSWSYGK